MERVCPYCGRKVDERERCSACHRDIAWAQMIYKRSEQYYQRGYREAKARNLITAVKYLNEAIYLDKTHIQARNLLGLVYYEIGELGSALKEWIISYSLEKENNKAQEYIQKVQTEKSYFGVCRDSIQLYNKALQYLKEENRDVAAIRLKKAVSLNPKFVKAHVLLALCYIDNKKYRKANEHVKAALKLTHDEPQALRYYKLLSKEDTKKVMPYEKEYTTPRSGLRPEHVLNIKNNWIQHVVYFVLGIICMSVIQFGMIMPNRYADDKEKILKLQEDNAVLNADLVSLEKKKQKELDDLKAANQQLEKENQGYQSQVTAFNQKDAIEQSEQLINEGSYQEAAKLLYDMVEDDLSQEDREHYESLKETCYSRASEQLCDEAYNLMTQEEYAKAKEKLDEALRYDSSDSISKRALYYMGRIEYGMNNLSQAVSYFDKVIENYPGTDEAYWCQNYKNEIESAESEENIN